MFYFFILQWSITNINNWQVFKYCEASSLANDLNIIEIIVRQRTVYDYILFHLSVHDSKHIHFLVQNFLLRKQLLIAPLNVQKYCKKFIQHSWTWKYFPSSDNHNAVVGFLVFLIVVTSVALLFVLFKIYLLKRKRSVSQFLPAALWTFVITMFSANVHQISVSDGISHHRTAEDEEIPLTRMFFCPISQFSAFQK